MGAGQPRGARAHDGDLPAVGRRRVEGQILAVAGGIVGHKGLEVLDIQGFIQMAPDTGPLAGVRADEAADPGEGVVLANHLQGLQKAPLTHQGHITGDVDARRAGHVARGRQELGTDPGRTGFVVRMHPVFIREKMERGENGIDRLAPQVAGPLELQALADRLQLLQGIAGGFASGNLRQQVPDPDEGLVAGGALGSGLIQEKVDLPAHQGDDAILLIQDLNSPQGQGAPQFPEGLVVQANLQEVGGKDAAQGAAHQDGLGGAAMAEAPAHTVDHISKGGRQGDLHKTGLLHGPHEAEDHGAGGAGNAQFPEPGDRGLGDEGQSGDGAQPVEQEGGVGVFLPERLRQGGVEVLGEQVLVFH